MMQKENPFFCLENLFVLTFSDIGVRNLFWINIVLDHYIMNVTMSFLMKFIKSIIN